MKNNTGKWIKKNEFNYFFWFIFISIFNERHAYFEVELVQILEEI